MKHLRRVVLAFVVLAAARFVAAEAPVSATLLPPGYEQVVVAPGLEVPTTFAFTPGDRILIAEKAGVVRVFKDGTLLPTPLIDIQDRVNDYWDRGLLGMTVDRDFAENGYLYLLYTHDNAFSPLDGPKTGRLTRVTVVGDVASPASEVILLGNDASAPCDDQPVGADCLPSDWSSHSIADVVAAADGTLFVSTGDAAPNAVEPLSLRAQNLDSMAGKILHINTDGTGVAGNPFWTGDANDNRSKIWARGVRNPFRMTIREETGMLYLGDVGWAGWEEINTVPGGANLGWPCYESSNHQPGYEPDPVCQALYVLGPAAVTPPLHAYPWNPVFGASVIGGDFVSGYPGPEGGAYFFGDYVHSWIHYLQVDDDDNLIGVHDFATGADGPVALRAGPTGDLYYLSINTGELRRIRWTADNRNPSAVASADTTNGPTPLDVQFSSEGSYDLDLDALFYEWDFGDGSPPSSEPNPAHTYATAGVYTATLTVEDGLGGQGTDSIVITAGNSAPDVTIDQPAAGDTYRTGDTITYEGSAVDPEDGPLPASGLEWEIILHHGKHTHPFLNGVGDAAFQAPDHGDDTWFELTVTAADSDGLAATEQLEIFPEEVQLRFETAPAGLYIVYDGRLFETPVTIITGADSVRDIRAPSPQLHSLVAATFNSWSDGGENEHAIDTGTTDRTITAFYDLGDPDDDSDGDGCADARELGSNVSLGGERDPFNEWDVYDTSGDQVVDFFTDFFAVVSLFGIEAADPGYVEQSDRSPPPSAALEPDARKRQPWDMGPPNGVIDLFGDIFGVVNQFGHSCQ